MESRVNYSECFTPRLLDSSTSRLSLSFRAKRGISLCLGVRKSRVKSREVKQSRVDYLDGFTPRLLDFSTLDSWLSALDSLTSRLLDSGLST
jgi:hypothetical protein